MRHLERSSVLFSPFFARRDILESPKSADLFGARATPVLVVSGRKHGVLHHLFSPLLYLHLAEFARVALHPHYLIGIEPQRNLKVEYRNGK